MTPSEMLAVLDLSQTAKNMARPLLGAINSAWPSPCWCDAGLQPAMRARADIDVSRDQLAEAMVLRDVLDRGRLAPGGTASIAD